MSSGSVSTPATAKPVKIFNTPFASQDLKDVLFAQIPAKQAALKDLKAKYGKVSLGEVTVDQVHT